ncbi:MAG: DUF1569 domain-containing protein [Flavobacteriales bacterium]
MERKLNKFFTNTLVNVLRNLKTDSKSEWGTMTPKQMLIHLIQSSKMMHFGNTIILIKEKHIKQAISFLYSDKEIIKGLVVLKDINQDIEELKKELMNSTNTMIVSLNKNINFKAIHPFFGELNSEQWLLFQRKHFTHHLNQFRLL